MSLRWDKGREGLLKHTLAYLSIRILYLKVMKQLCWNNKKDKNDSFAFYDLSAPPQVKRDVGNFRRRPKLAQLEGDGGKCGKSKRVCSRLVSGVGEKEAKEL